MFAAAFAVHELRYQLAFGARASDVLNEQGHGYLDVICPVLVFALVCGACQLLRVAASGGGRGARPIRLWRLWLLASLALVGVFVGQELIEGAVSAGQPPGLDGVFGSGGWMALPAAGALGLVVAFAVREIQDAIAATGRRWLVLAYRPSLAPKCALTPSAMRVGPYAGVLARYLAGRAPPLLVG